MLIDAIIRKFNAYFEQGAQYDTILWFDSTGGWRELLPHLEARLPRLIMAQGQLRVRYELAQRAPGERVVVYIQAGKEKTLYLRPFFHTAKCFQRSIEQVVIEAGVKLPDDPKALRQIRDLLPHLAPASIGKGRAFWEGLTPETALHRLLPDFEESLLRLLAAPRRTLPELQQRGLAQPLFERVRLQFGIEAPAPGAEEAWADRFTALLCLVAARAAAPTAPGFPFDDILPPQAHWEACRTFLHRWQHHELFKAAFKQRALALDATYHLGAWAAHLPPENVGSGFLNVEQALWQPVQARLDGITDKAGALAFVADCCDVFQQRAASFWAREGEVPGWQALLGMSETLLLAREALAEAAQQPTAAAMVARYAAAWQRVDAAYRRFSVQLDRSGAQLDAALKWTARAYREYLNALNERFTALAAEEGQWPPAGCALAGSLLWPAAKTAGKGLRALVLVDALRYELGCALAERLGLSAEQVQARLSPVPSITDLGMAALLPGWEQFRVEYEGDWIIRAPGGSDNLARKDKRLAYLAARLGKTGREDTRVFDLDQWLATPLNGLAPDVNWIVVTSQAIDAAGEGIGAVALHTFDALLDQLEHGVRRLLAAGCTEITIASDHGFLLRETVRETDKVSAKEPGLLKKSARYAIAHSAAYSGSGADWAALPHLPIHGSADLVAWFPRGAGCFLTPGPYNYMHGGIALQEVVIPVIQIRQTALERPVGVTLELADGAEIRNAIFKVRLHPTQADLLSTSRRVEIDLVKQGQRVSRVWEAQVERASVEKSLMLETAYGLQFGDTVEIRVRDAVTGELLDAQLTTIKVELDL